MVQKDRLSFIEEIKARGLLDSCTGEREINDYCASSEEPVAYLGFDCTADSLHIGSLIPIIVARVFIKMGGRVIILLGDQTAEIGDPTGRSKCRSILSSKSVQENMKSIRKQVEGLLPSDKCLFVSNSTWLEKISFVDFIKNYGRFFSLNSLIKQKTIAQRLKHNNPFSYLELSYVLMQSYDFAYLFNKYGCRIQIGGSDQWGNITGGINLIHSLYKEKSFGVTLQLLTDGGKRKMGKSSSQVIWLDPHKTSPFVFWQYWRNVHDDDVKRYIKMFMELSRPEVASIEAKSINEQKIALSNWMTTLVHGKKEQDICYKKSMHAYQESSINDITPDILIPKKNFAKGGIRLINILHQFDASYSKKYYKRLIRESSIKCSNKLVKDVNFLLSMEDFEHKLIMISIGKKRRVFIAMQEETN